MRASSTCRPRPLDPDLYAATQARAKHRFRWPSIYANAWVVRAYKQQGGTYAAGCAPQGQGLRKWFDEQWVDLARPRGPGAWAACGRPQASQGGYPKCVPLKRALAMTPAQIRSAVTRKRAAERGYRGGRAVRVPTLARR